MFKAYFINLIIIRKTLIEYYNKFKILNGKLTILLERDRIEMDSLKMEIQGANIQ